MGHGGIQEGAVERQLFFEAERRMSAFGQIGKLERADGNADETKHLDAEGIEHAADLAVFAFVEDDFEPGMFFAAAEKAGALCFENAALWNFDAALKNFEKP